MPTSSLFEELYVSFVSSDALIGTGIGGMTYGLVTGFVVAHLVLSPHY